MSALKLQFLISTKDSDLSLRKTLDSLLLHLPVSDRSYDLGVLIVREALNKNTKKSFFELINDQKYRSLKISYIIMKKGTGYIKNLNAGIKALLQRRAPPKYIAFLHDDVIINKKWLQKIISPLQQNSQISVISCLSSNKFDKQCVFNCYKLFNVQWTENITQRILKNQVGKKQFIILNKNQYQNTSLYSTVIRLQIFKKYGVFDQNLIGTSAFQYQYFKNLLRNNQKIALSPLTIQHQCKSTQSQEDVNFNYKCSTLNLKLKNQFMMSQKKYVFYTYLQKKDLFKLKKIQNNNFDYICFSNTNQNVNNWKVIDVTSLNSFKDAEIFKQFLKLHPHFFFQHFQKSIWIDFDYIDKIPKNIENIMNNMTANCLALDASNHYLNTWKFLYQMRWDEKIENQTFEKVLSLFQIYGFPVNICFINSAFLIRKNNVLNLNNAMNKIWHLYCTFIQNDKFLFNLCLWLNKQEFDLIKVKK